MCSFDGCDRKHFAKGLCSAHWQQQHRGRPLTPVGPRKPRVRIAGTLEERLVARSRRLSNGCLVWTGPAKPNGYAKTTHDGIDFYVHRAAYTIWRGPIPEGLTIDHLCGTRLCIEPSHLEPVTRSENTRRGNPRPEACKQGHALTEANVRWRLNGTRTCLACDAARAREYRRRKAS